MPAAGPGRPAAIIPTAIMKLGETARRPFAILRHGGQRQHPSSHLPGVENRENRMPGFVHLHVHSSYSLLEGALTIARLAELAKADRQPALALTDTDNMFGALEFSEKLSGYGIQPIVGCALAVDFGDTDHGPRNGVSQPERTRIVLLAAHTEGYRSLMRLNSRAFLDTPANEPPRLKLEWLAGETAGIIALTG